ncbi:CMGC/SRPK protein kinase [Helicocarpus griseus UAMH5409]|uniref:non-specific serine/threonine protein kinase n=1 Tax=Helicocarpus griseus UAMH5409 TaxID=1447875 RepID=A0A2B7Y6M0_9EURO|nr:CMGC/SRPK protein kinase [Helicocarpus griseus UAMH5409]
MSRSFLTNKSRRSFYTTGRGPTPRLRPSLPTIEEDARPNYDVKKYYPARVGETLSEKYRLISKLGWGGDSTVWLAEDIKRWFWQPNQYLTLKIMNSGVREGKSAEKNLKIFQRIDELRSGPSSHPGQAYIRLLKESFKIQGPRGGHICMVFEPLREPLWLLAKHLGGVGLPLAILKPFLKQLLQGLDFLHSHCHVIHTGNQCIPLLTKILDLKSDNFLTGFEDPNILENYVRQQQDHPAPYKLHNSRPIFQSRPDFGPLKKPGVETVKISDFSAAVFGDVDAPHNHDIQPRPFCAPEVLLKAGWSYSADVWNMGVVLWELLANTALLNGRDRHSHKYSRAVHLAQMIRLLGPPPISLLEKADKKICSDLFSSQGEFRFPDLIPPEDFSFSNLTPFLQGEEKRLFLAFAKRMLQWDPEYRATARELYGDPWLDYKP